MTWRVIEGDVRETLATLPARSAQTCVTSPPYSASVEILAPLVHRLTQCNDGRVHDSLGWTATAAGEWFGSASPLFASEVVNG